MQLHLEKLQHRLSNACIHEHSNKSENHFTATTWLLFFEDVHCRAIFDSSGNKNNDRPDIQAWFPKSKSLMPDIWVEAKLPRKFKSKANVKKAHLEVAAKILTSLRNNEGLPSYIIVTDFEHTYIWRTESFRRLLSQENREKNIFAQLGEPLNILKTLQKSQFTSNLMKEFENWISLSKISTDRNQPLDLEVLINNLISVSTDFRANFLSKSVG